MFNKRHYQAIAYVIQNLILSDDEHDDKGLIELESRRQAIALDFCAMLAPDNPQFKTDLFLQACRPGSNVRATKVKAA